MKMNISNSDKHAEVLSNIEQKQFINEESHLLMVDLYKLLSNTSHQIWWWNFTGGGFTKERYDEWCVLEQRLDKQIHRLRKDYPDSVCYAIEQLDVLYSEMQEELANVYETVTINSNEYARKLNPYRERVMGVVNSVSDKLSMISETLRCNAMQPASVEPQKENEVVEPKIKAKKYHKLNSDKLEGVLSFTKYRQFKDVLFADLELISNMNLSEIAIVAMLIYEAQSNKNIIKVRPKTYTAWLKIFAECLGIDKPISYNPAKLRSYHSLKIKELEARFHYLR